MPSADPPPSAPPPPGPTPGPEPVSLSLPGPLVPAAFRERPNRFVVRAALERDHGRWAAGDEVRCHLPDPGRLTELLRPGRRLWLLPAADPSRKTRWSALLVEAPGGGGGEVVSVDTTLPNRLVEEGLRRGALEELSGWALVRREFPWEGSRFDFLLEREGRRLVLEVKSVTLVEDGVALFPDAVTRRGARHVAELREIAALPEWEAAVLFVLQRADAHRIRAARSIDPRFADALERARAGGVRVLGRRCRLTRRRVTLGEAVPAGPG